MHSVHSRLITGLLALTCGRALDVAGGGVGLGGQRGGQQRPVALGRPSLPLSDCANLPEQSSSLHATPGALHATCTHELGTVCPHLTVTCCLKLGGGGGKGPQRAQTGQCFAYTVVLR